MCANCLSNTEVVVAQAATVTAAARAGLAALREDRIQRRLAAHRANAEFLAGMGLDPDAVLGPPPDTPAVARAPLTCAA